MKKFLMAAAALILVGAGCSAQTSGDLDVQAPTSGSLQLEAGADAQDENGN